jgi:phenylalanyl-tRNA synthetase beta chain
MGGEGTGVTGRTTDILLEAARFSPQSIRRTSRDLGMVSDSSYRFERGIDPAGVLAAANRAIALILEVAGGEVSGPLVTAGDEKIPQQNVKLRHARAEKLMGVSLNAEQIEGMLTKLGLRKQTTLRDRVSEWRVPSYRLDLTREVDLIEELTRVYGINNIPSVLAGPFEFQSEVDRRYDFNNKLVGELVARGFFQIRTWTLISQAELKSTLFTAENALAVRNPLSEDHTCLRPSLLPGMLKVVRHNVNHGAERLQFFEMGRIYHGKDGHLQRRIALGISGPKREFDWKNKEAEQFDLHDLRGFIQELAGAEVDVRPDETVNLALGLKFSLGGLDFGHGGMLSPGTTREMKLTAPFLYAELDMDALEKLNEDRPRQYREISRYPAIVRDIALTAPLDLPQDKIISTLRAQNEPLLREIRLFDLFQDPTGKKLPADRKSLAYTLVYRSDEKTLENETVQKLHDKLVDKLEQELDVELRRE